MKPLGLVHRRVCKHQELTHVESALPIPSQISYLISFSQQSEEALCLHLTDEETDERVSDLHWVWLTPKSMSFLCCYAAHFTQYNPLISM